MDPAKPERRRVPLDRLGEAGAFLTVIGPHAEAYALESKILGELADAYFEPVLLSRRRRSRRR